MADKSIVGDLINFRGLVYAPTNENGVVFLFGKIVDDLNMDIEEIKPGFPDCIARRFVGRGWEKIAIEFEYQNRNFKDHNHDPNGCDIVVCWEHNWKECPIEVVELMSEIQQLENHPVQRPGAAGGARENKEKTVDAILAAVNAGPKVGKWYDTILTELRKTDDSIWEKVGNKYVGWYSPERSFASVMIRGQSIRFACFAGDKPIPDAKVLNKRFCPRWCKIWVKSDQDANTAVSVLTESYKRINKATKDGELTSYYSGGEKFGTAEEVIDSEDENEEG